MNRIKAFFAALGLAAIFAASNVSAQDDSLIVKRTELTSGTSHVLQSQTAFVSAILVSGGGAGGSVQGASGTINAGEGGAPGEIVHVDFFAVTGGATLYYHIGAAGASSPVGHSGPLANWAGGDGGDTEFGDGSTTYTATGATGGGGMRGKDPGTYLIASGSKSDGGSGGLGLRIGDTGISGDGGTTPYGIGGAGLTASGAGNAASGYGAGGGGAFSSTATNYAGGAGSQGVIYLTEYSDGAAIGANGSSLDVRILGTVDVADGATTGAFTATGLLPGDLAFATPLEDLNDATHWWAVVTTNTVTVTLDQDPGTTITMAILGVNLE